VISTFLRAIRAGVISVNHGSVLLAHYGRLGITFDTCVKVVVDVLREEGLMGGHGEMVVSVVTKAIQEVLSLSHSFLRMVVSHDIVDRLFLLLWTVTLKTSIMLSSLPSFLRVVLCSVVVN